MSGPGDAPQAAGDDAARTSYAASGVDVHNEEHALAGLLGWVRKTFANRAVGTPGHVAVDVGYFASVLELTQTLGLAVAADGVGTKLLVAQLAERYEGVGIDLVAMNVNDLVCVGAEPIAMLDYVAVEVLDAKVLERVGKGLHDGAAAAGITIAGGELAQIGAMLRGAVPGRALDLAGVAIGVVPLDRVNLGATVRAGDVVVGLASSGIHSNGLSLARKALLERAGLKITDPLPGDPAETGGQTVADALLVPTRIYVKPALEVLADPGVEVTALAHITGGGFANMSRIQAEVGFVLDQLPPVPPVFKAIQEAGQVPVPDLYAAYNMGVGFTFTVRPGGEARVIEIARRHGIDAWVIGRAVETDMQAHGRRVSLPGVGLVIDDQGYRVEG